MSAASRGNDIAESAPISEGANAQNPLSVSEQFYLLFEGAISASQLHGELWPAEFARQTALSTTRYFGMNPRRHRSWFASVVLAEA